MDLREYSTASALVRHPWERARARLVEGLLEPELPQQPKPVEVLDVGSGDGWLARQLADDLGRRVSITCYDRFYTRALLDHLEDLPASGVTYTDTSPTEAVDVVLALDVIEHVEDDAAFVRELAAHLRPGGRLLVTVPAHQALFGPHDVALGHFRRYSRAGLVALLAEAGLEVHASGHLFASLYGVRRAQRRREQRRGEQLEDDASEYLSWEGPEWLARGLAAVLVGEGTVTRLLGRLGIDVPGLSCWSVAVRP